MVKYTTLYRGENNGDKIWHNNRCSKSREALKLLEDQGKAIEICNYLQEVPSVDDIKDVLNKLAIKATDRKANYYYRY